MLYNLRKFEKENRFFSINIMLFCEIQTNSLFDITILFKFIDINYFIQKHNFGYRLVTDRSSYVNVIS